MDLKDKTIVITGAGRGLGRKMAEVIAGEKAKLALAFTSWDFRKRHAFVPTLAEKPRATLSM
jgi:NAD(P)-dependent dehydrogenase (short-subunit alcohol dehydrogenase family)